MERANWSHLLFPLNRSTRARANMRTHCSHICYLRSPPGLNEFLSWNCVISFRGHDRISVRKLWQLHPPPEWLLTWETIIAFSTTRLMWAYSEVYTCSSKNMSKKKNLIDIKEPLLHTKIVSHSRQFSQYSDHIINHKGPIANKISSSVGRAKQYWKVNTSNSMNHKSKQLHLLWYQQATQKMASEVAWSMTRAEG